MLSQGPMMAALYTHERMEMYACINQVLGSSSFQSWKDPMSVAWPDLLVLYVHPWEHLLGASRGGVELGRQI